MKGWSHRPKKRFSVPKSAQNGGQRTDRPKNQGNHPVLISLVVDQKGRRLQRKTDCKDDAFGCECRRPQTSSSSRQEKQVRSFAGVRRPIKNQRKVDVIFLSRCCHAVGHRASSSSPSTPATAACGSSSVVRAAAESPTNCCRCLPWFPLLLDLGAPMSPSPHFVHRQASFLVGHLGRRKLIQKGMRDIQKSCVAFKNLAWHSKKIAFRIQNLNEPGL